MTPDIKTLQCFLAVAECGNVTRAAESLYMTQPALSLRLKQLAQRYKLTLFRRTSRGLDLTDEGLALVVKARQVISSLNDLERTAMQLHTQICGDLRIGTVIDPEFIRLGAFLHALVETAPRMGKELRHGMSGNVRDWVARKEVDAGYFLGQVHQPNEELGSPQIYQKPLADFAYWVVAPPGWEARVADKDWDGLARLPWVGTSSDSVHRRLLQQVYRERAAMPRFVAWVDQESSMLAMVRSGVGLSLCRDSVALLEKRNHGLVINERVSTDCTLSFICLEARRDEAPIACAFDVIERVWGSAVNNGSAGLTSQSSSKEA